MGSGSDDPSGGVQVLGHADAHLLAAIEVGRLGVWSWDPATGAVEWDPRMESRYGLQPGEFTGTFQEFVARIHPDDREWVTTEIAAAQQEQRDLSFEHRVVWPDGSVHWLEARGRILVDDDTGAFVGVVGVGIDIDERKQLEALTLEEAELRATAELVHNLEEAERIAGLGSWYWTAATNVAELSPQMARMLGCARTMTGEEFRDFLQGVAHPDDAAELQRVPTEAVTTRQRRYRTEWRLLTAGEVRHVVHRGELLVDDDDNLVGVRGTAQDVTEQRRAEAELLAAADRLAKERRAVQVLHETLTRPEFPAIDGYEIAARYLAAEDDTEIGGDWYDAFAQPDGRIMLVVGDVSGHGIPAARFMAKLRHATRAYACIESDLSVILEHLDGFLGQFRDESQIATLLLIRLDAASGALELASAGHLPPLVIEPDGAAFATVPPGPPLGAGGNRTRFGVVQSRLDPRCALLLYTDGLIERRAEGLDAGFDRLVGAVRAAIPLDASAMCDLALAASLAGVTRQDDVCVLAMRRA